MSDAIAEAIREHWGEKCGEFEPECPTCQVWAEFAELSRLSALVAEWQKAGAEAEAQMMALYISVSPHATYERDGKIGNRFADEDHAIAGLRRLSQLKDTTNADK